MKRVSCALVFLICCICIDLHSEPVIASKKYPVDISFIIVDLKYSGEKGVQICEIQQGAVSKFEGYDFLYGEKGLVARKLVEALSQYQKNVWYMPQSIADSEIKKAFHENEFQRFTSVRKLIKDKNFLTQAFLPVDDANDISSYHGVVIGRLSKLSKSDDKFRARYPGVVPMDSAFLRFKSNKADMNHLLKSNDELKQYKPRCGIYKKSYSEVTVQKINKEIGSDLLVIKPIETYVGNGVIIVQSEDLKETLKYIFSKNNKLKSDPDPSYSWWAKDGNKNFLVEEFVPSDTVYIPHLNNLPYDPTMRVAILLVYHDQSIETHFIECHWKLPEYSLDKHGTLNEKHKSSAFIPNYGKVDSETQVVIEAELGDILRRLYRILLTQE